MEEEDSFSDFSRIAREVRKRGGGQIVGIKKTIKADWTTEEWEYGLLIKIKLKDAKETEDNYIIATGYNNKPANINKFIRELDRRLEELEGTKPRGLVACDFNARIGEGQGIAECGMENLKQLPTCRSEDKEIIYEGKKLIEWCEEKAMIIMNGRAVGNEEGKITYVGHGRGLGSVLDLVLVKMEEELRIPDWFKGLRVAAQEGSDHLPVLYRLSWRTVMSESEDEGYRIGYGRKGKLR